MRLEPVSGDPFAPASSVKLEPVDFDPFQDQATGAKLEPVDHDPFAAPAPLDLTDAPLVVEQVPLQPKQHWLPALLGRPSPQAQPIGQPLRALVPQLDMGMARPEIPMRAPPSVGLELDHPEALGFADAAERGYELGQSSVTPLRLLASRVRLALDNMSPDDRAFAERELSQRVERYLASQERDTEGPLTGYLSGGLAGVLTDPVNALLIAPFAQAAKLPLKAAAKNLAVTGAATGGALEATRQYGTEGEISRPRDVLASAVLDAILFPLLEGAVRAPLAAYRGAANRAAGRSLSMDDVSGGAARAAPEEAAPEAAPPFRAANPAVLDALPGELPPSTAPASAPLAPQALPAPAMPARAPAPPTARSRLKPITDEETLAALADPENRARLEGLAGEAGWAQEGGRLVRALDDGKTGESDNWGTMRGVGEVSGRTSWVPKAPWFPEVQRSAPLPGNTDGRASQAALRKAFAGEPMTTAEKRHVGELLRQVRFDRAEAEEAIARDAANAELRYEEELLAELRARPEQPTPRELALSIRAEELLTPDELEALAVRFESEDDYFNALEATLRERDPQAFNVSARADPGDSPGGPGVPQARAGGEGAPAGAGEAPRPFQLEPEAQRTAAERPIERQAGLPGIEPRNDTAQAIADAQRAKQPKQDVPPSTGGGLFSDEARQTGFGEVRSPDELAPTTPYLPKQGEALPAGTQAGGPAEIAKVYDEIAAERLAPNEKRAVRYAVENRNLAGLETQGMVHSVDSFAIRKVRKDHGNEVTELMRGNLPVTKADFERIPEIVRAYDAVENVSRAGEPPRLRYTKRFNGTTYYVEEVRAGRNELAAVTLWKVPTREQVPPSSGSPLLRPERFEGTSPQQRPEAGRAPIVPEPPKRDGEVSDPSAAAAWDSADVLVPTTDQIALLNTLAGSRRELGQRVKHVNAGTLPSGLRVVQTAEDVAHVAAPLRKGAQEQVLVIVTDEPGQILKVARLAIGGSRSAPLDPAIVAGVAINTPGARRVHLAHNHPSGNASQSNADDTAAAGLRRLLEGSGVQMGESVVVAPGGRGSAALPRGRDQPVTIRPAPRREALPVTERRLVGRRNEAATMFEASEMRAAAQALGDGEEGVLLVDNAQRPLRFVALTSQELGSLRRGEGGPSARLLSAIEESNASGMVGVATSDLAVENLHRFGNAVERPLLEAFRVSGDGRLVSRAAIDGAMPRSHSTEFYANPFSKALAEYARDIGLHPGRSAASAVAGGVVGGTVSPDEPLTPKWWAAVGAGAAIGTAGTQGLRRAGITGKGAFIDNALTRIGAAIERLPGFQRGPIELRDLKRKQQAMRQLIDGEVADMGRFLRDHFTPAERGQMADLIESRGIIADFNMVHRMAGELEKMLTHATERLKALKMLPPDLEAGGYLHRYYRKHLLEGDSTFKEAKRQSLSGTYAIARGTNEPFAREYLSPLVTEAVERFQALTRQLDELESARSSGGLFSAQQEGELATLRAERRALGKQQFHEYVGEQGGAMRRFLFASDEVPLVPGDHPLGYLDTGSRIAGLAEHFARGPGSKIGELLPTGRRWSVRGEDGEKVLMHRDWTKAEREAWGEIGDAGYRYVRGMAEVSHDLSIATLFDQVARNSAWVSRTSRDGWIQVPASQAGKGSAMRRYGALSGLYVRPDVWGGLKNHGRQLLGDSTIAQWYRAALGRWKLWKTVYNPVTHFNNTHSNVQMLLMAGYSPKDLARGMSLLRRGDSEALVREATEEGVLDVNRVSTMMGVDGRQAELDDLARELLEQPQIPDATLVLSTVMKLKEWAINSRSAIGDAKGPWQTGAALARAMGEPTLKGLRVATKPLKVAGQAAQRLYRFEDEMFKMAVFAAERSRGSSRTDAARAAQQFFFDYGDLPDAMKAVRDLPIGSPFISYTYFAIPAIARNIVRNPEYVLALAAAYEAVNYAGVAMEGLEPGQYWNVAEAEDELSAPWDRGRSGWGARNTVHVPGLEGYRLALGNAHALGNIFQAESGNRSADMPLIPEWWGSDIFGSNPLRALLDVGMNEDWKGREIYKPGAPDDEKARAAAAYLWQAWTPSNALVPGGYQQSKLLEGLANDAREAAEKGEPAPLATAVVDAANRSSEYLGFGQFTGLDRGEHPIVTRDALLASMGIKLRPIRFDEGAEFERKRLDRRESEVKSYESQQRRLAREGRISFETKDQRFDKAAVSRDKINQRRDELDEAEALLMRRGGPAKAE